MESGKHLKKRKNWQRHATDAGKAREEILFVVIKSCLLEKYKLDYQPIISIYDNGRGIQPDASITNMENEKKVLIESKRQGASGNAHERMCRNYMPGIVKRVSAYCKVDNPIFTICMNGLAKDKHKSQEIECWFQGIDDRVFLWKDAKDTNKLERYIIKTILPYLE